MWEEVIWFGEFDSNVNLVIDCNADGYRVLALKRPQILASTTNNQPILNAQMQLVLRIASMHCHWNPASRNLQMPSAAAELARYKALTLMVLRTDSAL